MVRAAVSGAIDYSRADPTDTRWRVKHRLLLTEIQRREDEKVLAHNHKHWCAYLGHGNLTEDSFESVRENARTALQTLHEVVFPWIEKKEPAQDEEAENTKKKSKIDKSTQALIERFKVWQEKRENQNNEE
jgi:hypothetical protein